MSKSSSESPFKYVKPQSRSIRCKRVFGVIRVNSNENVTERVILKTVHSNENVTEARGGRPGPARAGPGRPPRASKIFRRAVSFLRLPDYATSVDDEGLCSQSWTNR